MSQDQATRKRFQQALSLPGTPTRRLPRRPAVPNRRAVHSGDQAAPFLLRCLHSCHPLSQSDYLEILPPPGPVPLQLVQQHPQQQGAEPIQRVLPMASGVVGLGWTRPGPRCPETDSLSSLPLTGATGNQAGHRFASVLLAAKWTQISHPFHLTTRRAARRSHSFCFHLCRFGPWKSREEGKNPLLVGARGSVRNLGCLDSIISVWLSCLWISHFLSSPIHRNLGSKYRPSHNGVGQWAHG